MLPTGGRALAQTSRSKSTSFYTKVGDQICSVGYYKE